MDDSMRSRRVFLKVFACAFAATSFLALPVTAKSAFAAAPQGQKILIVYYSKTNNTRTMAHQIQSVVGGDMIELKTVRQYPEEHNATVKIAVQENKSNARPELTTIFPENMNDYDIIFAGYPVWEYTMPMAFFTFFDQYKFAGKTIIPFSTHLGSRLGGGPRDIAKLCPQAKILEGLAVRGPKVADSQNDIAQWLKNLNVVS